MRDGLSRCHVPRAVSRSPCRAFKVTQHRGKAIATPLAAHGIATVHPSSILRAPDDATRRSEYRAFVRDLKAVAKLM